MPISGKEMAKLFKKEGFEEVKGGRQEFPYKIKERQLYRHHSWSPGTQKKGTEHALRKQLIEYK